MLSRSLVQVWGVPHVVLWFASTRRFTLSVTLKSVEKRLDNLTMDDETHHRDVVKSQAHHENSVLDERITPRQLSRSLLCWSNSTATVSRPSDWYQSQSLHVQQVRLHQAEKFVFFFFLKFARVGHERIGMMTIWAFFSLQMKTGFSKR